MSNQTLLEKAKKIKAYKVRTKINDEEYELGLAWAKGEVSISQIQKSIGYKCNSSAYALLSQCFARYVAEKG